MFAFLRLLFGSIDGAEEHAHTRNKVHAKNRKIGFSRNFCSAIYTYSTVYSPRCDKVDDLFNETNQINLNLDVCMLDDSNCKEIGVKQFGKYL